MDKQKQSVMDEFVNRHNGVNVFGAANFSINGVQFTAEEFTATALELGWVSGYKWGVEYQTNGKKPDLQKDLRFKVTGKMIGGHAYQGEFVVDECDWSDAITFCITDPRYKPISKSEPEMSKECQNDFPFIGCLAEHINWGMPIKIKFLGERFFIAEKTDASNGKGREVCGFIGDLHPIKSERELLIDVIASAGNLSDVILADAIIAAGWSRVSEKSSG